MILWSAALIFLYSIMTMQCVLVHLSNNKIVCITSIVFSYVVQGWWSTDISNYMFHVQETLQSKTLHSSPIQLRDTPTILAQINIKQSLYRPWVVQDVEALRCPESRHRPPLLPAWVDNKAMSRSKSMKNAYDTIGNRTRNLPACSAVPQPTAPLFTPVLPHISFPNTEQYF
jgi:hypothetical protein